MDDELEEIRLLLNDHSHEIGSLKHRMDRCENQQEQMSVLTRSVDHLAMTMEKMVDDQKELKADVKELKSAPAKDYNYYKRLVIGCVITTILGAVVGAVIAFIIK